MTDNLYGLILFMPYAIVFTIMILLICWCNLHASERKYARFHFLGGVIRMPNEADVINNPDIWVHEATETTLFQLLGSELARKEVCINNKWTPTVAHLLTSLHTISMLRDNDTWHYLTGEEFEAICPFKSLGQR